MYVTSFFAVIGQHCFRHQLNCEIRLISGLFGVFKAALFKTHPIQHFCYLSECCGKTACLLHRRQMNHLICSPLNRPPVAAAAVGNTFTSTLLLSHLPEQDPVTHVQRNRLHTTLCQWATLHGDANNRFINNSEAACMSHTHAHKRPPNILWAVIDKIRDQLRTTTC